MLIRAYASVLGASLSAGVFALEMADRALCEVPCYRQTRDKVLDNLFGPAEDFEYIVPTTPT